MYDTAGWLLHAYIKKLLDSIEGAWRQFLVLPSADYAEM